MHTNTSGKQTSALHSIYPMQFIIIQIVCITPHTITNTNVYFRLYFNCTPNENALYRKIWTTMNWIVWCIFWHPMGELKLLCKQIETTFGHK